MMVRDEVTNPAKNKRHALRGIEEKEICQIQVGLDITTRSVPTQMVAISRMSLYREDNFITTTM